MSLFLTFPYKLSLASKSPRRRELLAGLGFSFETVNLNVEEDFPQNMAPQDVPLFLAQKKAAAFDFSDKAENTLVITADTLVILENQILEKPADKTEAIKMLERLSGRTHLVITGVCLRSKKKEEGFSASSLVSFKTLSAQEIEYYVENYRPYDKAGAYGIQEWIGYIGIERLEGSFYNVMGLPTQKLFSALLNF